MKSNFSPGMNEAILKKTKSQTHRNRGKMLEKLIDTTNYHYVHHGLAFIKKVPTPFKIIGKGPKGMYGHTERGEWVDYVGVIAGHSIAFDAKQTAKNRFPFDSLHEHQYNFLANWHRYGHRAFLIIEFTEYSEYYLLPFVVLRDYWEHAQSNKGKRGTQSIPYEAFQYDAIKINKRGAILEYLEALDSYYT